MKKSFMRFTVRITLLFLATIFCGNKQTFAFFADINVALASNGATVTTSSNYQNSDAYFAAYLIDGDKKGIHWWNDNNNNLFPDWLQIDFNGSKTLKEINIFTIQDNYANPADPTEAMTFNNYGVKDFDVQTWNGSAWVTTPGGVIRGNNKIWYKLNLTPIATSKIRVMIYGSADGWARVAEVEAISAGNGVPVTPADTIVKQPTDSTPVVPAGNGTNIAVATRGCTASASKFLDKFVPSRSINADRRGLNLGIWACAADQNSPQWLQANFSSTKTIHQIDVFTSQDDYFNPVEPTEAMTFSNVGIRDFEVQTWNGTSWVVIPGGKVTGNNKVWRKFVFPPITTSKMRVVVSGTVDGYARITEIQAWGEFEPPLQNLGTTPFYIIMGQSNVGWNRIGALSPQQKALYNVPVNAQIFDTRKSTDSWFPLTPGVNTAIVNGMYDDDFGVQTSFIKNLCANLGTVQPFIFQYAVAGTNIAEDWNPKNPSTTNTNAYFKNTLAKAIEYATESTAGKPLELKGIIMVLGEADGVNEANAKAYAANLKIFFDDLHAWLITQWQLNSLTTPFNYTKVIARLNAPTFPYRNFVRAAQEAYCSNPANKAVLINTDGYELAGDQVHYTPNAQVQFGIDVYNVLK